MRQYALGLDFGTMSVRALLVDVADGTIGGEAVARYPDGVIDRALPQAGIVLPPDWVLQNPLDWLATLEISVTQVLRDSGVDPAGSSVLGSSSRPARCCQPQRTARRCTRSTFTAISCTHGPSSGNTTPPSHKPIA